DLRAELLFGTGIARILLRLYGGVKPCAGAPPDAPGNESVLLVAVSANLLVAGRLLGDRLRVGVQGDGSTHNRCQRLSSRSQRGFYSIRGNADLKVASDLLDQIHSRTARRYLDDPASHEY